MNNRGMVGLALATVLVLAGCGGGADPADSLAVSRTARGGECATGPCLDQLTVHGDGSWSRVDETGRQREGRVGRRDREAVVRAEATTRLAAAPAATSGCATPDAPQVTYAWRDVPGTERQVSSCDRQLPADDPLVSLLDGLASRLG